MDAAPLRQRLTLEKRSVTAGSGDATESFPEENAVANIAAWVEPATASLIERRIGTQIQAPVSHLVTIRFRPDVTVRDRWKWTRTVHGTEVTRYLWIRGLHNPGERNQWLICACEERL